MNEMMKRFIDKEVLINVMNSEATVQGFVKEVNESWLVVDTNNNGLDMINIEYITRIREYPRKENGKKKQLFA